jgi:hypothetical protein
MHIEELQPGMIVQHPEPEVLDDQFIPMKVRVIGTSPLRVNDEDWTQVHSVWDASPNHPKPSVTFGRENGTDVQVIGQV